MIMSASFSQKNPGWARRILDAVGDADRYEVAVGFPGGTGLEAPHYTGIRADGTTTAGPSILDVAIWNNYGAEIHHPGGTPYFVRPDGMAQFVGLGSPGAERLPRTRPHTIRIPPRPFFDLAAQAIAVMWKAAQEDYHRQILGGGWRRPLPWCWKRWGWTPRARWSTPSTPPPPRPTRRPRSGEKGRASRWLTPAP